jgi:chemotaxis receptor (MCP) glutamine deamidase CheD
MKPKQTQLSQMYTVLNKTRYVLFLYKLGSCFFSVAVDFYRTVFSTLHFLMIHSDLKKAAMCYIVRFLNCKRFTRPFVYMIITSLKENPSFLHFLKLDKKHDTQCTQTYRNEINV